MAFPLLTDSAALAAALRRLEDEQGLVLPLLDEAARVALLAATEALRYRAARPLVGPEGREVRQDFELTLEIPSPHPLRSFAAHLGEALNAALGLLDPDPLPDGILFNDVIVQRYAVGSAGITPHRDHVRYVGLVALVTLAGEAELVLSDDRSRANPRPLALVPGSLVLLTAPGFAGRRDRPFHCLTRVGSRRVSLGLRQDTRPGEPT